MPETTTDRPAARIGGPRIIGFDDFRRTIDTDNRRIDEQVRQLLTERAANAQRLERLASTAAAPVSLATPAPTSEPEPVDELTGHCYDGIEEYDNPTPGWWHLLFIGTVAFSVAYVLWYHLSGAMPSLPDRHDRAQLVAEQRKFGEIQKLPMGEAKLLRVMSNENWLGMGRSIFQQHCVSCHAGEGQGMIGPNLHDEAYIAVSSMMDIVTTIKEGRLQQGMPPQRQLNDNEVALVAAYAASLRGAPLPADLQPPALEPKGIAIPPWPTLDADGNVIPADGTATDSTSTSRAK